MIPGWSLPAPEVRTCVLCGERSTDVTPSLWEEDGRWVPGVRCRDHVGCRARITTATDATGKDPAAPYPPPDTRDDDGWTFG